MRQCTLLNTEQRNRVSEFMDRILKSKSTREEEPGIAFDEIQKENRMLKEKLQKGGFGGEEFDKIRVQMEDVVKKVTSN